MNARRNRRKAAASSMKRTPLGVEIYQPTKFDSVCQYALGSFVVAGAAFASVNASAAPASAATFGGSSFSGFSGGSLLSTAPISFSTTALPTSVFSSAPSVSLATPTPTSASGLGGVGFSQTLSQAVAPAAAPQPSTPAPAPVAQAAPSPTTTSLVLGASGTPAGPVGSIALANNIDLGGGTKAQIIPSATATQGKVIPAVSVAVSSSGTTVGGTFSPDSDTQFINQAIGNGSIGAAINDANQASFNGTIPLGDGSVKLGASYNPTTGDVGGKLSNAVGSASYNTNGTAEIGVKLGDGLNGVASTGPGGSSAGLQYTIPLGGGQSATASPAPSTSGTEAFNTDVPISFGPGVLDISEPQLTGPISLGPDFVSITSPMPDGLFNNSTLIPGAETYFTDFGVVEPNVTGASGSGVVDPGGVTVSDVSAVDVFGDQSFVTAFADEAFSEQPVDGLSGGSVAFAADDFADSGDGSVVVDPIADFAVDVFADGSFETAFVDGASFEQPEVDVFNESVAFTADDFADSGDGSVVVDPVADFAVDSFVTASAGEASFEQPVADVFQEPIMFSSDFTASSDLASLGLQADMSFFDAPLL